jgi:hypothetical protein
MSTQQMSIIYPILALCYLARSCIGFSSMIGTTAKHKMVMRQHPPLFQIRCHHRLNLSANDDENNNSESDTTTTNKDDKSYSWEELQADPELSRLERNSSIQRKNAMLLPQRISQATSIVAWTFVIGGIILNTLGYAYIRDPSGGIGIGTLK